MLASGASAAIERALSDLGLRERALEVLGIRLFALGMPFPLDDAHLAELTEGLERVLVVEDKNDFLEGRVKQALYGRPGTPAVFGRRDEAGHALLPVCGSVKADDWPGR